MFPGFTDALNRQRYLFSSFFDRQESSDGGKPYTGPEYSETRHGSCIRITLGRKPAAIPVDSGVQFMNTSPARSAAIGELAFAQSVSSCNATPSQATNPFSLTAEDREVARQTGLAASDMVAAKVKEFINTNQRTVNVAGLTPEDIAVARQMGITNATMLEYKAVERQKHNQTI